MRELKLRSFFLPGLALLLCCLAVSSILQLSKQIQVAALADTRLSSADSKLTFNLQDKNISELRTVSKSWFAPLDTHAVLYRLLRESAERSKDGKTRIDLYCQALSEIGLALKGDPRNAAYLINWANLRQLLGQSTDCKLPYTHGDFLAAVEFAIHSNPNDERVLFAAAHIYDWAKRDNQGAEALKHALGLSTSLSPEQINYVLGRLNQPKDIETIVPATFPQIAIWSAALLRNKPELFRSSATVLSRMQQAAVVESAAAYQHGAIPSDVHYRRIISLYRCQASSDIRQQLDAEVAHYFEGSGNDSAGRYMEERRHYAELPIIQASLGADTRPLKTALVGWGVDKNFFLDEFYASIGFYLPQGRAPKLIELRSERETSQMNLSSLKVMVSDNNFEWTELQGNVSIEAVTIGSQALIAIHPNAHYYKYWKINFFSSARTRSFINSAEQMIAAYGNDN